MKNQSDIPLKECALCNKKYPATKENFYLFNKKRKRSNGEIYYYKYIGGYCKTCNSKKNKKWVDANIDKSKEWRKEYNKREEVKDRRRNWAQNNKGKIKAQKERYKKKNKDKIKEYHAKYNEKNREKLRIMHNEYDEKNREKRKEFKRNQRKIISDGYAIIRLIRKGFSKSDITEELIKTQRVILKTKRLIKNKQS